jgi:hypothetical protein
MQVLDKTARTQHLETSDPYIQPANSDSALSRRCLGCDKGRWLDRGRWARSRRNGRRVGERLGCRGGRWRLGGRMNRLLDSIVVRTFWAGMWIRMEL